MKMLYVSLSVNRQLLLSGSTLVPTTVRVMGSARLATQPPAECTASATNTGKGKPATSLTVGTTAGAPTTATVTSPARSCASATTVGKVRASSCRGGQQTQLLHIFMTQLSGICRCQPAAHSYTGQQTVCSHSNCVRMKANFEKRAYGCAAMVLISNARDAHYSGLSGGGKLMFFRDELWRAR